ncbi:MAG: hypothetical protein HKM98_00570 [Gammaproteobacteria bacterium]|nr:hypothetical protein [Gammaproteobacteria bacterium]
MSQVLDTAPTTEPVTLNEARLHLRIDDCHNDDDSYVEALIKSARHRVEGFLHRALISQTWKLYLPEFPTEIMLPMGDVQSVSSVEYVDTDGSPQTLATSEYQTDLNAVPARIKEAYSKNWPSTRVNEYNAVTVTFVAGYGAASAVPEPIKQAILLIVGHLYENRENVSAGTQLYDVPQGADSLLWPYRIDLL